MKPEDLKLEEIENPRLLKLKEKTLAWKFNVVYVRGKVNVGPDAMSRITPSDGRVVVPSEQQANSIEIDDDNDLSDMLAALRVVSDPLYTMADQELDTDSALIASLTPGTQAITWNMV